MKKVLTPAERLIVAADFKPGATGRESVRAHVLALADILQGTGVTIKVNSILRACGYDLIDEIHARDLKVFADLKLYDIGETLETDAQLLRQFKPELVTVCCDTGFEAMKRLKDALPNTEVLGVTILTTLKNGDMERVGRINVEGAVQKNAMLARCAGLGGLICSPKEVHVLRRHFSDMFTYNTPGVRFAAQDVLGDDQNPDRVTTPFDAINLGADRIVIGRPIIQATNPRDAVKRVLDEIAGALA